MCVQNHYNIARREDEAMVALTAEQGIAYVPYFPLGGFSPLQSDALDAVARRLGQSRLTVALAWLLQRSPNVLLIPGTSSVAHLRDNVASAGVLLPEDALAELDAIGTRRRRVMRRTGGGVPARTAPPVRRDAAPLPRVARRAVSPWHGRGGDR